MNSHFSLFTFHFSLSLFTTREPRKSCGITSACLGNPGNLPELLVLVSGFFTFHFSKLSFKNNPTFHFSLFTFHFSLFKNNYFQNYFSFSAGGEAPPPLDTLPLKLGMVYMNTGMRNGNGKLSKW